MAFLLKPGKKTKNDDYFSDKEYANIQLISLPRKFWSDTNTTDDEDEDTGSGNQFLTCKKHNRPIELSKSCTMFLVMLGPVRSIQKLKLNQNGPKIWIPYKKISVYSQFFRS